jgi:hypothetical protein
MNVERSTAAAMFDTTSGQWNKLPSLPKRRTFIYLIGGRRRREDVTNIWCFDLMLLQWVDTGIADPTPATIFPPVLLALDNSKILVVGVETRALPVICLDVISGEHSQLPPLPFDAFPEFTNCCYRPDGSWVVFDGYIHTGQSVVHSIARLTQNDEWEVNFNTEGSGLKLISLRDNMIHVGGTWLRLPEQGDIKVRHSRFILYCSPSISTDQVKDVLKCRLYQC